MHYSRLNRSNYDLNGVFTLPQKIRHWNGDYGLATMEMRKDSANCALRQAVAESDVTET